MSELHDRLERLAARGTRRGVDDVLNAAIGDVRAESAATDIDADVHVADDDVPFVMVDPDVRSRGRFGALVGAVGVAALVGVGALAVSAVFGSGGAGSPEAAVRQLADAISHKDPLAAVDVLVPSEVRSMRETVKAATKRAADLQVVNDASQPLAGVDLSVDHLQLSTQSLADGFAKVTITSGEISATTHEAAMSKLLQDAQHDSNSSDTNASADLAKLASGSDLPTFVVTVRHDGGWYVSPAYTALEYAREAAGGPAAGYGSAKAADLGADSPEHAVSDALHAWQAGDWDRLMALAPPDELPVYDFRAWIEKEAVDTHPDFTIDKLNTSATVNGDTAIVKLDASGTTGSGSDEGRWQVGGTCPSDGLLGRVSVSGGSSELKVATPTERTSTDTGDTVVQSGMNGGGYYSRDGASQLCLSGDLGDAIPFGLLAYGSDSAATDSGPVSVEAVRESGRWFVSPVTTVLDAVDATIQRVDKRSIYTLLGLGYELPPDGAITIDQPFSVPAESSLLSSTVFSFDGTKGQNIVGEISDTNAFASAVVYTAGGHEVDSVEFSSAKSGGSYAITLPETGSYRLVVAEPIRSGTTLTLWDAKDAPKGLVGPPGGDYSCTTTMTSQSCSSSGITVRPVPGAGGSGSVGSSCSVNGKPIVCPGSPGAPALPPCPQSGPPSAMAVCVPQAVAQQIAGRGSSSLSVTPATTATKSVTATTGVSATTGP